MNIQHNITTLIALHMGADLPNYRRPATAAEHIRVAKAASDAAMRLAEGTQALGRLLTEAACCQMAHGEFERAGMLLEDVAGIVSSLSGLASDSANAAAELQGAA